MGKIPCCDNNGLKKGPWTAEEDQKLIDYVQKHGHGKWRTIPKNAGLKRCGKSCRLRWTNYLRPDIKRGRFTFEEEETIIQLHSILGNKWSAIAARLPGRTDNEIKNHWNTHIRKRLLRMGIDPVTHSPRLDLLELYSLLNSSLSNSPQLNIQSLLEIQPAVNANLLSLATSLASSQYTNLQFFPQNLQEEKFSNPQVQNHFQPFHESPLSGTIQEFQATTSSTPSRAPLLDDTLFVQASVEQFSANPTNSSCKSYFPNLCQYNGQHSSYAAKYPASAAPQYCHTNESNQSFVKLLSENQMFQSNTTAQNIGFGSVISTPSSSSTPLNSSITYVNASIEDERDSCSNMIFQIPNSLDVGGFM